jgi:hypothetical protein
MARPSFVRSMNSQSATINAIATPRMKSCTELTVTGPI